MTGVSTNASSAAALALLTGSTKALEDQQKVVVSGKTVDSAADNAAYWSMSTAMNSHSVSMSAAMDASGVAQATADVASLGMDQATSVVSKIQSKLILAKSSGVDKNAINSEISQLKEQLGTVAKSASFSGQNWLSSGTSKPGISSMVASVSTAKDGGLQVNTLDFDTSQTNLVSEGDAADGLLTKAYSGTTPAGTDYSYHLLETGSLTPSSGQRIAISNNTTNDELDGMIGATNSMLSSMTNAGAALGATSNRLADTSAFTKHLQDTLDKGVGKLVDANMEEDAVKLSAARVQSQLQTVGLSISNQQTQSLTQLFL
jgi:flagellin